MFNKKKASVTLYFVFIVLSVLIVIITSIFAPFGILLNTELYAAGEQIMLDANESISGIQDAEIRGKINNILTLPGV